MNQNNAHQLPTAVVIVGNQHLQNSLLSNLLISSGIEPCVVSVEPGVPETVAGAATVLFLVDATSLKPADALDSIDDLPIAEQKVLIAFFNLDMTEDVDAISAHPSMHGVFPANCPQEQITKGVKAILRGEVWLPRKILEHYMARNRLYKRPGNNASTLLTDRELEVLKVMATGAKNTDIAEHLSLSPHTIKTHIYNIFKKINASNRLQAVNWAQQNL